MEPQTNNVMDLRTFGRMFLGRQPGQQVTQEEFEADKKAYDYYVRQAIDRQMASPAPTSVQFGVATNSEGRVTDYAVVPEGVKLQVLEPKVIHAQTGAYTLSNPTNASPIIDPRTGQQVMGYAADPMMGSMPSPAPLAGGQMAATNAPTAVPVQTPAPSPTPAQLREGMIVRQGGVTYKIVNGQPVVVP